MCRVGQSGYTEIAFIDRLDSAQSTKRLNETTSVGPPRGIWTPGFDASHPGNCIPVGRRWSVLKSRRWDGNTARTNSTASPKFRFGPPYICLEL